MDTHQSTAAADTTKAPAKYATAHNRLKPVDLPRIKKPGYYHDGGGLYLDVRNGRSGTTMPGRNSAVMLFLSSGTIFAGRPCSQFSGRNPLQPL